MFPVNLTSLDPFRVPDSLLGDAYDSVTPQQRAWLKTTQALVQSVHAEAPARREQRCWPTGTGFAYSECTQPVAWTVVMVAGVFAAACRLSAALMTARLAGVENVLVFFADSPSLVHPAVFAACELAGVENLFSLAARSPSPENLSLFDALLDVPAAHGRILTFGPMNGLFLPFPTWRDTPPRLALAPDCALSQPELQAFHPDAVFVAPNERPDALYSGEAALTPCPAPLCLGPGLEGTWLHTGLCPSFFHRADFRLIRSDSTA